MAYMLNSSTLNAHTPVSTACDTRVTTHSAFRDNGKHRERAWGMINYFMQNIRENKSETMR